MSGEIKALAGVGLVTAVIIIAGIFLLSKTNPSSSSVSQSQSVIDANLLVRNDSNKEGSKSAKVKLIEFGDFQCPACSAVYPLLKKIKTDYKGKILFVFRNFPLSQHKNAKIAAEAAEAAGEQGKYWEMHDKLYENQAQWSENTNPLDIFLVYAKEIEIDTNKFKETIQNNKFAIKIQNDINDGNNLSVNATPTLFINSQKLEGIPSYNQLKNIIDSELNK